MMFITIVRIKVNDRLECVKLNVNKLRYEFGSIREHIIYNEYNVPVYRTDKKVRESLEYAYEAGMTASGCSYYVDGSKLYRVEDGKPCEIYDYRERKILRPDLIDKSLYDGADIPDDYKVKI